MSLDVYLYNSTDCPHCGKLVKGSNKEYDANITHNLGEMASKAGIYYALWRPEEIGIMFAKDLIPYLERGLNRLKSVPDKYKKYNSPNGWGMYEHFVPFVEDYLLACRNYPDSIIETDR